MDRSAMTPATTQSGMTLKKSTKPWICGEATGVHLKIQPSIRNSSDTIYAFDVFSLRTLPCHLRKHLDPRQTQAFGSPFSLHSPPNHGTHRSFLCDGTKPILYLLALNGQNEPYAGRECKELLPVPPERIPGHGHPQLVCYQPCMPGSWSGEKSGWARRTD